ncbi:MAG TPA: GGDEF domain-containing protein [Actinomycetota bacterium]|nr:GGDEF domain-containing protein [Actinomycetota bacterium]
MSMTIMEALDKRSPASVLALGLAAVGVIAAIDYATGAELAFSVFYLAPIIAVAWVGPPAVAGTVAVAAGLAFPVSDLLAADETVAVWVPVWNFAVRSGTYLVVAALTRALRRALDHERDLARIDPLTGALNARSFFELAEREVARSRRHGGPVTVVYLDLDGFKEVNDEHGHSAGDEVLKEVASMLYTGMRPTDVVGRLGGDEFALLLPDTDAPAATNPLNRMRAAVRTIADKRGYGVSVSVGAATFVRPPDDVNALLRAADGLMYEAKNAGKDRIVQRTVEPAEARI